MLTFEDGVSLYRKRLKAISAGEATLNIEDDIVLEGKAIIYQRVSVENRTTAYTRLVIGVMSAGLFHRLEEHDNPGANDIFWTSDDINVKQGENLRVQLSGTTTGDEIYIYVEGVKGKPGDPNITVKEEKPPPKPKEAAITKKERRRLEVSPHQLHWFPRENLQALIYGVKEAWKAQVQEGKTGEDMPVEIEEGFKSLFPTISEEATFHIEHLKSLWKDPGDPTLYRTFIMPPAIETEIRTIYSLIGKTRGE